MKLILKITLSIIIVFCTLLTLYKIAKIKIDLIETTVIDYFNKLLGDYGYLWLVIIGINLIIILDIILRKMKTDKKVNSVLTIIGIPFSNLVYIWKRK